MNKKLCSLVAVVLAVGFGCGGGNDITSKPAKRVSSCFGRVIDRSTRVGIASATVELLAGSIDTNGDTKVTDANGDLSFVATTTTTADNAKTTLFDESGMWRIDNLPTGGSYRVRIGTTDYATVQTTCNAGTRASNDNTPIAIDIGDVNLTRAVTATVNLLNNGAAVASCPVFAVPVSVFSGEGAEPSGSLGQGTTFIGGVEVSATTDTAGKATLAGLDPFIGYTIVAPACDTSVPADKIYDTQTVTRSITSFITSDKTVTLNARSAGRGDAIALVSTNGILVTASLAPLVGLTTGTVGGIDDILSIGTSSTIVLVFNFPVTALPTSPGVSLSFVNNLVTLTGVVGFPQGGNVAATCALSAGNTVLTCTPASALVVNEMYQLNGTVAANIPSGTNSATANQTLNLSNLDGDGVFDSWYIFATTGGLSATTAVTADNYNNTSAGAATNADLVYLEFPELVYGRWTLVSSTDGTSTLAHVGCTGNLTTNGAFLFEGNAPGTAGVVTGLATGDTTPLSGGAATLATGVPPVNEAAGCTGTTCPGTSVVYRVPIVNLVAASTTCSRGAAPLGGLVMTDNITATPSTIVVNIDATDVEGNRLQAQQSIAVQ